MDAPTSESSNDNVVPYGVDWSDRARPSSHCWFPLTSDVSSAAQSCVYGSCAKRKQTGQSALLQCASCDLIMHAHHLTSSSTANNDSIQSCRPSFVDNTEQGNSLMDNKDNPLKFDEHFWSHVSTLLKPCMHCQPTSMVSPLDIIDQMKSMISCIPGTLSDDLLDASHGLVCLWCYRCYHHSCWEQLAPQDKLHCDYGIFQNIIVRPQWLSRSSESPTGFKARSFSYSTNSNAESNSFPYTPVLVFINKRSGGQVGEKIYRELLQRLNPRQVFLLENNATITHALDIYSSLPNMRICVFGGDGTVGWVLSRLAEAYPSRNNPPVSICPLGTGNDLSRVLAWGEQYDPKRLFHTLIQTSQAQVAVLDRWKVQLEEFDAAKLASMTQQHHESGFNISRIFQTLLDPPKFIRETNRSSYENHQKLPNTRFINYMSFGLDAAIALDFHVERTRDPSKFSSPLKNKFMYVNESCKYFDDFARAQMWNLGSYIRLICDDQDITDTVRNCHTLVILNIPGYASGTNPWGKSIRSSIMDRVNQLSTLKLDGTFINQISMGSHDILNCASDTQENNELESLDDSDMDQTETLSTTQTASSSRFQPQNFGDRKIEVVGLSTTHMAAIHAGFRGNRIAQCNRLCIELRCPMTAQMDGEPFYLPTPVAVNISHADQVLVLKNKNK
ncbi:unnamed protein product [Rotaria sordida]|uniref:Diacylglycerol kinase n=1 Tax=Rotaria sordida TaxID=392033 RepID=A0A814RLX1_9BILA|nr:unnamed protein product [Rotaria sordida]CAF1179060.1 unnamed protein product [Rotaria sordida]